MPLQEYPRLRPAPARATPVAPTRTFEELKTALLQYGFLTGSRAFGGFRPNSDWDIAYLGTYSGEVKELLKGIKCEPSEYFSGSHFLVEGHSINIVPLHPVDFYPWYLATKAMKTTFEIEVLSERNKKHAVFMGIVSLFKAVLPEPDDIDECKAILAKIHFNESGRDLNTLF